MLLKRLIEDFKKEVFCYQKIEKGDNIIIKPTKRALSSLENFIEKIIKMDGEYKKLKKVVEFYANKEGDTLSVGGFYYDDYCVVEKEYGKLAKNTLKELNDLR